MIETATLRADFPIFSRLVHGKPLIYLDSAATSQKPKAVIQASALPDETQVVLLEARGRTG